MKTERGDFMVTQEQHDSYQFQQSEAGQNMLQMVERMKTQYCTKLHIPVKEIRTGRLKALVNGKTGQIDRFYEE